MRIWENVSSQPPQLIQGPGLKALLSYPRAKSGQATSKPDPHRVKGEELEEANELLKTKRGGTEPA